MPTDNENTVELNELIPQLIAALQAVTEKVDEIAARQDELDSVLYDGLIGPANEALAQQEYDNALSDFRTKYAQKLGPYEEASRAIEGDDFDVFKEAFDNYNDSDYSDISPDEYVDALAANLQEQIAKVREAVAEKEGVEPEDVDVEVSAEDGEVTVDVDDTTTEEKPEDDVTETVEEEVGETLDDFEKSLKEELDKNPPKVRY